MHVKHVWKSSGILSYHYSSFSFPHYLFWVMFNLPCPVSVHASTVSIVVSHYFCCQSIDQSHTWRITHVTHYQLLWLVFNSAIEYFCHTIHFNYDYQADSYNFFGGRQKTWSYSNLFGFIWYSGCLPCQGNQGCEGNPFPHINIREWSEKFGPFLQCQGNPTFFTDIQEWHNILHFNPCAIIIYSVNICGWKVKGVPDQWWT